MKYMLDTNICIYLIANRSHSLVKKFEKMAKNDISVSVVVASELAFGAVKSQWHEKNQRNLDLFLSHLTVTSMTDTVMWHYAKLRYHLQREGKIIGENDQWIAAHALAENAILVTNNGKAFSRVSGLQVENWVADLI